MKHVTGVLTALLAVLASAPGSEPGRVLSRDQKPADSRLGKPKDYNGYFPMTVPANKESWEARQKEVREQVLVAEGLWPMPEKTPLRPVVHGKIDRDGYTIEKVFFASYPGYYVCGNLYWPKGKSGKLPAVLSPHGHWNHGRFFEAGAKASEAQVKQGAEKTLEGARYPLQARCAQLARLGCVVFHYDMVGYADSQQITHREGFTDAEAELRLQSFMGLQTYNSIRALDFLLSLPDVDPRRVGVTGASGGGTQTFILGAIDDRPAAAFPAVMVSTAMQGGCVCENCSYLRQDTGNIELAALFAPRPLGMTGAHDWTHEIETKGLPELKVLYRLYGAEDRIMAKCFLQFEHNYNQVSRELMYNWFNKHLHLGQAEPVVEKPFVPVPPKELSVFDEQYARPGDAVDAQGLRKYMTQQSERQLAALEPKDKRSLEEFRRVVGTALRVMVHDRLPRPDDVEVKGLARDNQDGVVVRKFLLGRKGMGEQVPAVLVTPPGHDGRVVVWIHPAGKASLWEGGKWTAAVHYLFDHKAAILAPDVLGTGKLSAAAKPVVDAKFAGFTFGYNRPLLANRVHDVLTAVAYARQFEGAEKVYLAGFDEAGPWVVLARALCGDAVSETAADLHEFSFTQVKATDDEMMLPGALKYGDLPAFLALCAPGQLHVYRAAKTPGMAWVREAYRAAGADYFLQFNGYRPTPEDMLSTLVR